MITLTINGNSYNLVEINATTFITHSMIPFKDFKGHRTEDAELFSEQHLMSMTASVSSPNAVQYVHKAILIEGKTYGYTPTPETFVAWQKENLPPDNKTLPDT